MVSLGWDILASGGTAKYLKENNISARCGGIGWRRSHLGHRVVTFSREIHAGLMARPDVKEDMEELERLKIPFIDLVCVDFIRSKKRLRNLTPIMNLSIEATDIGGPTLIRSAAKGGRIVICDPEDRERVIEKLKINGDFKQEERIELAAKAEYVISKYCLNQPSFIQRKNITEWLANKLLKLYTAKTHTSSGKIIFSEKE